MFTNPSDIRHYFSPGPHVGPFFIKQLVGRGSFSTVYRANSTTHIPDRAMERDVALKILRNVDFNDLHRHYELEAWRKIADGSNPNIIKFDHHFMNANDLVIVMEFARDGTLQDWIECRYSRSVPVNEICNIAEKVLASLSHVHDLGFVHRDIKARNILLQAGNPLLTDFGLARRIDPGGNHVGGIKGSILHMAPEVWDGNYSRSSDIWAMGVLFYQLLTGHYPFPTDEPAETIGLIRDGNFTPLPPQVPSGLRSVVHQSLQKRVESRFSSADEMINALAHARKSSS